MDVLIGDKCENKGYKIPGFFYVIYIFHDSFK
jgi:hypothetical protein